MDFSVTEIAPEICRVALRGRGDASGVDSVETGFTAAVSQSGCHAALDLAEVPFMGSLGIRMLIACARVMTRRGRKLVLFAVQPMVMEVFETVALSDLIPIASDEAAALALITA